MFAVVAVVVAVVFRPMSFDKVHFGEGAQCAAAQENFVRVRAVYCSTADNKFRGVHHTTGERPGIMNYRIMIILNIVDDAGAQPPARYRRSTTTGNRLNATVTKGAVVFLSPFFCPLLCSLFVP